MMSRSPNIIQLEKPEFPRTDGNDLSFKGQRLLQGRHRVHPYPAMLHPFVSRELLRDYANKNDILFDPFCGSGSVLVNAMERGHHAIGFDINPLALLIAEAKTTIYDEDVLKAEIKDLQLNLSDNLIYDIPNIKNIDFWYDADIAKNLGKIRHILLTKPYQYSGYFIVCFAYLCRTLSFTRKGEFKRHREKETKRGHANVNVGEAYLKKLISHIPDLISKDISRGSNEIRLANSEHSLSREIGYDLVVTSPPYGDHRTTVAYGQYSSFGNEWTEGLNPFNNIDYRVDNEGLGKPGDLVLNLDQFPILANTVEAICEVKAGRADDVLYFFNGYWKVLNNVVDRLRDNGRVCFVVGNRTVAGFQIALDQITAGMLVQLGLEFLTIRRREITNKVMPLENSPTNEPGKRSNTMTEEFIVVCIKK